MGDLLNIGAAATELYRQALSTVSNNIANLNSDGYSRQEVRAEESIPTLNGVSYLGSGVNSKGVFRAFDEFATSNVRVAISKVNEQEPLMRYTDRLVDLLGSEEGSLSNGISTFFSATSNLSGNAAEESFRQEFLMAANFLTARSNSMGAELASLDAEITGELKIQFSELNKTASSLALVNKELSKTALAGKQPPMLLDQRDFLLKDLSKYASLDIEIDARGRALVKLAGSSKTMRFVDENKSYLLDPKFAKVSGGPISIVLDSYGKNLNVGDVQSGSIGGTLNFRNTIFEPLRDNLDILVTTMANSINNIHKQGLNNSGAVGLNLFDLTLKYAATNAGDGTLSSAISVSAASDTPKINIQATWEADKSRWSVTDLETNTSSYVSRNSASDNGFTFNKVSISANATLGNGQSFLIRPDLRAIDNFKVSLLNTAQIATADRLQIEGAIANSKEANPSLEYDKRALALNGHAALDTGTILGIRQTKTFNTNTVEPALFIPRDVAGFTVSIQPLFTDDHQFQLFTSEHNHLVGSDTLAAGFKAGVATASSIEAGAAFINTYVNEQGVSGYKDTTITLGSYANDKRLSSLVPIQTNGTAAPVVAIAANNLTLNGVDLSALNIPASSTLSAANVAAWINDGGGAAGSVTANTGVTAKADSTRTYTFSDFDLTRKLSINGKTIVNVGAPATLEALAVLINGAAYDAGDEVEGVVNPNGTILIRPTAANVGKNILLGNPTVAETTNFLGEANGIYTGRVEYTNTGAVVAKGTNINFGFKDHGAGTGRATDLSRIGLATTITSSTRLDDDFLVYVTGAANDVAIRYDIKAKPVLPEVSIEPAFSLTFLTPSQVQITDTTSNTIMAKKNYVWPSGVLVNDVKVVFEEAPTTGDVFTIKANEGAIGDNGNMMRILAVKDIGVDGNEIPIQKYISLVSDIGNKHHLAQMSSEALQVVKDDAQALLDNTTGVTLDTEAADLIRYQQSYQAAAQIIKVSQDIFATLLAASR
jgi:flagellar hook-associated protein FlgK|tara:strand:+ start:258 stop:3251 length:2994 start_codon:yes stop_codon:yes gene_type:complete